MSQNVVAAYASNAADRVILNAGHVIVWAFGETAEAVRAEASEYCCMDMTHLPIVVLDATAAAFIATPAAMMECGAYGPFALVGGVLSKVAS